MQYDPQVSLFLKNVPDPAPGGTTTQKLIALLKSSVQAHADNAMMALASATAQGNNAELARDEGLIPVFLEQLQNPKRQKDASFAIMIICTKDKNAEMFAENGKWTVVLEVLEKLPFPLPDPEVPKNLISALHYLSLNAKIRPLLGQANHLKVLFEYAGKRANPVFIEKLFPVLLNLCNADTTKESIRTVGGIPTLISFLSNPTPALRDAALKIIWQITKIDKNRQELRKGGVLKPLLAVLELPLPASQDIIVIALRVLGNLAMDDDFTVNYITENNLFGPLVKLLASKNPNVIEQTGVCMQYLATESSIASMAQAGAYDVIMKACKESNAFLPRLSLIYSFLLIDVEVQSRFVETGGPQFLLSFFDYNNPELNKHACRGIANVTGLYDDIKAALGTETCLKHLLRLSQSDDKQTVEYAVNALINLARYEPIGLLLNKIGGVQFIAQLVDSKDKGTMIKASMVLTNLSRFGGICAVLVSMGWIEKAVALATNPDPEVQVQGAKLLINFAVFGRNRKYVHDKGLLEKLKSMKTTTTNANAKSQLEIAVNNLSFPYEERYEGLDFKLEEKLPVAGEYNYDEESDEEIEEAQKSVIYTKLMEENKKKLEIERKRIERERKEADDQLKKQQDQIAKKRKEEEEQMKKKKAEEEKQRALKKKQDEELLKKQQEEDKRKIAEQEAAAKKAVEDRKRIEAEQEKRRAEEEEKKKKKQEEKQRKAAEGKEVLTPEQLAAKAKRKEERRLRNEDRQRRREEHAKKKIEKAQRKEAKEKKKVEKALQKSKEEQAARAQKLKEEEETRLKTENEERAKKEKEAAAEEAKIKKEHDEKEKKRKAELAALEADAKKKEEEAAKQAEKEVVKTGGAKEAPKDLTAAKAEKRVKITQEIVSVEKGYVSNLSIAIRKFLNPLTISASTKKPILSLEKVKAIFSIIEIIYNYNSLLLEGLETRMKRWIADNKTTPLCFGDIFVKMTDYMTCYSTYINNYNTSMETLLDAKKNNPEFAQFLRVFFSCLDF